MDDCPEMVLKTLCCTCLSRDRKLFQLCRLADGVNNLYLLLSYDSDAYREGFYKDTASLFVCWECKAVMSKIRKFRYQACSVQKQLTNIADGQIEITLLNKCLSQLTKITKSDYDDIFLEDDELADNFIDCGPVADIKAETDDLEDVPLSELHCHYISDGHCTERSVKSKTRVKIKVKKKKKKISNRNELSIDSNKKYFTTAEMNHDQMLESRERRKLTAAYSDAAFKCEHCIEGFKSQYDLDKHNIEVHVEKVNQMQCDICLIYLKEDLLAAHKATHYVKYSCKFCDHIAYSETEILSHLKSGHAIRNITVPVIRKKGYRRTPEVAKPGSKPRQNRAMMDKRTPYGYVCPECNKYFDTKNKRWKHVQRHHREGYTCETCGKRFAFRNNLNRHEQLHRAPPPREECPVCHKMIRVDLVKVHARIHSDRERFTCVECEKCFVSRASYEHHLKYTQAHAAVDILKYKCSMCDKGYRSKGELRDHVNYQHMGKTQHKCPICGKALATRRCITRHVRRAHDGVKESARDKICQQCGKAFRDKKGLREHEFIHTGERPLSCEICGCTFRQSASLYTHRKRVHKIYPQKKNVELLESENGVEG